MIIIIPLVIISLKPFQICNVNHTLKLGLDWYADKKNIFGVIVSGFSFKGHPTPTSTSDLYDANMQLENRLVSSTDNDLKFQNATLNLNWKHSFDTTGREITADFDYVVYNNVSDMILTTNYYTSTLQKNVHHLFKGICHLILIFTLSKVTTHSR
jgi:hypothetical protein